MNLQLLLVNVCLLSLTSSALPGTFNAKEHGAKGDGQTNDTKAIEAAIKAADDAPGVNTVYFPKGIYNAADIKLGTKEKPLTDVILLGEGPEVSVLRRAKDSRRDATIAMGHGAEHVTVKSLGFDANGVDRFGGFKLYNSKRITVTGCRFMDSQPTPLNGFDRFGFILMGCEDLMVSNNYTDGMQMQLDAGKRVKVVGNVVVRARETGGIGMWGVNKQGNPEHLQVADDYLIKDNWIIDNSGVTGGAFIVQVDGPQHKYCHFRNLRIVDNVIVYGNHYLDDRFSGNRKPRFLKCALKLGIPDTSKQYQGMVFENITFENNRIYFDPALSDKPCLGIIVANIGEKSGFKYDNLAIKGNTLYGGKGPFITIPEVGRGKNFVDEGNKQVPYEPPPKVPDVVTAAGK